MKSSGSVGSVEPAGFFYSRNGQFSVDKQGYIVNENGMYLTGFQPSVDGTEITDDLIKNNGLLRMPASNLPGTQTVNSRLTAMLDSTANAFTTAANVPFDPGQSTFNNKTTQTVFDNEGTVHTLEVFYRRINDTKLAVTAGVDGYTYTPSVTSTANMMGTSKVTLSKDSLLRVETPSLAAALSGAEIVNSTNITLSTAPILGGQNVSVTGKKIFVNGVDSGFTVATHTSASTAIFTASGNISLPKGASITFYDPDIAVTLSAAPTSTSTLTMTSTAGLALGDKVYLAGVETGATITSIGTGSVTLSESVSGTTAAVFKHVLNMTLVSPDGTEISLKGSTNKKGSLEVLSTNMSQVEVYASIDNKFYDYSDSTIFSNRKLTPDTQGVTSGYKAVAKLSFVGGRNIDSLMSDPVSGESLFKTTTTLSSRMTNLAGGTNDLLFTLDLSDTSLQAGPFQITKSTQDGEPLTSLTNVSVDNSGRILGIYGSGKQRFVGQVALVNFVNDEDLKSIGKNAFAATVDSGTEQSGSGVTVGRAGNGIFGDVRSQALESSNVDLANELVRLMVLQRTYSANSQAMKAFDQTMRDTLQMIG